MNLADSGNATKFVKMLTESESCRTLTEWENQFVYDMRTKFDSREDALDLGQTPWNPTVNQWNTLHGIWSKL